MTHGDAWASGSLCHPEGIFACSEFKFGTSDLGPRLNGQTEYLVDIAFDGCCFLDIDIRDDYLESCRCFKFQQLGKIQVRYFKLVLHIYQGDFFLGCLCFNLQKVSHCHASGIDHFPGLRNLFACCAELVLRSRYEFLVKEYLEVSQGNAERYIVADLLKVLLPCKKFILVFLNRIQVLKACEKICSSSEIKVFWLESLVIEFICSLVEGSSERVIVGCLTWNWRKKAQFGLFESVFLNFCLDGLLFYLDIMVNGMPDAILERPFLLGRNLPCWCNQECNCQDEKSFHYFMFV